MTKVLPAKPAHATVLAELHAMAMDDAWAAEAFADFLEKPSVSAILVTEEGTPVGFVLAQRAADEAEILMIVTHPHARRKNYGKQMIISVTERLKTEGVGAVFLEVAEDNAPARALYVACGFAQVGKRKDYYLRQNAKVDALLLRLDLIGIKPGPIAS